MSHWTVDPGSVVILGRTQTGKTSLARQLHARNDRLSIWLNEQGANRVPQVTGKTVSGFEALRNGMQNDRYKFNWLSSNRNQDIRRLQNWMWDIAAETNRQFRMQLIVDELHRLSPQSNKDELLGRDDIRRIAKEGMKRNVKLIGITQDPVALDKQTIRQREYLLLFGLSKEQQEYVGDYVGDISAVYQQDQFEGVLYHSSGELREQGVKADKKFAV